MGSGLLSLLLIISVLSLVKCQGYYSIVAPGTIRPYTTYNVAVSIYNVNSPSTVKLELSGPQSFSDSVTINIPPHSTHLTKFNIQDIPYGRYTLKAEGISGLQFKNETELNYREEFKSIHIQTDKATYKPGDLVRFRVLFLNSLLLPSFDENSTKILIEDSQGNTVMHYTVDHLNSGVYDNHMQLSPLAPLNQWKIIVERKRQKVEKHFEVAEYVLPKFEVTIDVPDEPVYPRLNFAAIVKARYTYGKYVDGEAKLTLMREWNNVVQQTKTVPLKGKAVVHFDIPRNLYPFYMHHWDKIILKAEVTDNASGLKNEGKTTIKIHKKKHVIKSLERPKYMPLDGPFSLSFQVTNTKGIPIQDTCDPLQLVISIDDTTSVDVFVGEQFLDKSGVATFKIKHLENTNNITLTRLTKATAMASYKYAEDLNVFIDIKKKLKDESSGIFVNILNEDPSLHEDVQVLVESQEKMKYFVYQVMAGGKIILAERVEVPDVDKFGFKFTPTSGMAPTATIFVYYVSDGELYFGEEEVNFVDQFKNFLKVKLPMEAAPGDNMSITVSTEPGSYVGLLGVDQSVLLQKTGNDLDNDKIINDLKKYRSTTTYPKDEEIERKKESIDSDRLSKRDVYPVRQGPAPYIPGPPWYPHPYPYPYPEERIRIWYKIRDYSKPYPGEKSGLITMTNAQFPYWKMVENFEYIPSYLHAMPAMAGAMGLPEERGFAGPMMPQMRTGGMMPGMIPEKGPGMMPTLSLRDPPMPPVTIRKDFPETWLWESIPNVSTGSHTFKKTVPDTITSWVVTGFSVNPEQGLALDLPKKLRVFQPFFISLNLPYSVINGEVISIPVIVFNYLDRKLETEVTMYNEHEEFVFTEATNEVDDTPIDEAQRTKKVVVPSDSTEVVYFMIRPKKVGKLILKVNAITHIAGDVVEKVLLVKPEGVTKYVNKGFLIEKDFSTTLNIDLPQNVVSDSVHIEVSVAGDLLGPTLNNLRGLVRIPSGCGEQNMVNFVPNYLVLEYLQTKNQLKGDIESTAIKYLQTGYQGELRYKHPDGSFSAFGRSDRGGCTWLTAYVARSFKHASKYIDIDEKIIKNALDFLVAHQAQNGSFPEVGVIVDKKYASAGGGDLVLTAFTLLSFLDQPSEKYGQYQDSINRGLDYLVGNLENLNDIFSQALVSYVLQVAKHKARDAALDKLIGRAFNTGGKMWWSTKSTLTNPDVLQSAADVEITSYALLAILESDEAIDVVPIVKWLLSKQDSTGGFGSTQNTVVGLQALIKFAEKFKVSNKDFKVIFKDDLGTEISSSIDDATAEYFRTFELSPNARKIFISTLGEGSALAQISYQYNVKEPDTTPSFISTPKFLDTNSADFFKLETCTKFVPKEGDSEDTNMAVMELSVPSGFLINEDNVRLLNLQPKIKKIEIKNDDTVAVFYFDNLNAEEICPTVQAHRVHKVAKQKPAPIVVYDYYDSDRKATIFYDPPNFGLCDICEGEDCGKECTKVDP